MNKTKICCIGAGYVGGPTMAVIASKCPHLEVTVLDISKERIDKWNGDTKNLPIYEPGLDKIIEEHRDKNLFFSTDIEKSIYESDIIFMAVNTPTKTYGLGKGMAVDLTYVENCARMISDYSSSDKIVVEKSTIPVRTAEAIKDILKSNTKKLNFEVLSNPEFLAEGTAIEDLSKSDRVLIGGDQTVSGKAAIKKLVDIYLSWVPEDRIVITNIWSAELSKLVSNAFLAQRISSINSVSALCEVTQANVSEVAFAVGKDTRIGSKFLNASVGFGGSCFQKDILNLVYLSRSYGLNEVADYWQGVIDINNYQKSRFVKVIVKSMYNTINDKLISLLGWSFKKDTNDSRESASIYVCDQLLSEGSILNVYDPRVSGKKIKSDLRILWESKNYDDSLINEYLKRVNCFKSINKVFDNSHAIVILTEWDVFKNIDYNEVYNKMLKPSFVFDGRKILNKSFLENIGFKCYEIGS